MPLYHTVSPSTADSVIHSEADNTTTAKHISRNYNEATR